MTKQKEATRDQILAWAVAESAKLDLTPEERTKLFSLLEKKAIEKARNNFYDYVLLMGPVVTPDFISGRHIELISNELQHIFDTLHVKKKPVVKHRPTKGLQGLCRLELRPERGARG